MVYLIYFFQSFARFSSDLGREMHAGERRVRRKKRGQQPEKTKESLSFFVPLASRAFSHARFARRTKNKKRLLVVYRGVYTGISYY